MDMKREYTHIAGVQTKNKNRLQNVKPCKRQPIFNVLALLVEFPEIWLAMRVRWPM